MELKKVILTDRISGIREYLDDEKDMPEYDKDSFFETIVEFYGYLLNKHKCDNVIMDIVYMLNEEDTIKYKMIVDSNYLENFMIEKEEE